MSDFWTSLNVHDYPEPPPEKPGRMMCADCLRQIYAGEMVIRDTLGYPHCPACIEGMDADEIYELMDREYDPAELISLLGGEWEEV